MKRFLKTTSIAMCLVVGLAACTKDEYGNTRPMTDAEKGALIGIASGALAGSLIKDHRKAVLIGAVGGGLAGGAVGSYMDSQKRNFEKVLAPELNAGAIDLSKLPGDVLKVTMTANTAFAVDSARIQPGFYSTLDKIAGVLNRYGKTSLTIVGHTDSTGTTAHNQVLSEQRAQAVVSYLLQKNVLPQRLSAIGKGESEPRATNATAQGRALNRRVEILIVPVVAK